jgi:predicted membrane-bound spermidine synthase
MNQEIVPVEYCDAFRSVRAAKNLFWWLIAAAIVVQLAAFVLVNFVGVIDPLYGSAGASRTAQAADAARRWDDLLHWALPATKFLALVSGMLLSLVLLVAVKLSLVGRLGGVAGLISAFFWSLLLLAIVTPWQQVMDGAVTCGALYNLGELTKAAGKVKSDWGAKGVSVFDQVLFHARFVAFPLVALLVWLTVHRKFARGHRGMNLPRPAEVLPHQP